MAEQQRPGWSGDGEDPSQDTEGHGVRASDRNIKSDIEQVPSSDDKEPQVEEADEPDAEGHGWRVSDRETKSDVEQVPSSDDSEPQSDDADTEGDAAKR